MKAKTVLLIGTAILVASFAYAQQHQFRDVAPRGAPQARMQAAAPSFAHRAEARMGGVSLQGELDGVVAEALGLTPDELHALKAEGASIAQIAEDRGVALTDVEAAYLAARQEAIDALLAEGAITEAQAEVMVERGAEAFATLARREGCAEGRIAGGEPLHQFRSDAPRGAQGAPMATHPGRRGPAGRW